MEEYYTFYLKKTSIDKQACDGKSIYYNHKFKKLRCSILLAQL